MRITITIAIVGGFILLTNSALAGEKVTICHATGSQTNPFVEVTIAKQAWENGHSPHAVHVRDFLVTEGQACRTTISTPTPASSTITPTPTNTPLPIGTPLQTPIISTITATTEPVNRTESPDDPVASSTVEFPTALPNSGGEPPHK
jgi:hypothetical protein